jgi:biopolymer transport protein TolR
MGMNLGGGGGIKSEINVTPLVDVMLVLLIIMMLVAPLLQKGVDVRLPVAGNTSEKPDTQDDTVLAVQADRTFYINGIRVPIQELRRRAEEALESKTQKLVLIKADTDAEYGAVMEAMDELRAAGVEDMGLITDPKARTGGGAGGAQ